MTTKVLIDRSTLRRNPNAGRTSTFIPTGVQSSDFDIERDGRVYTLELIDIPAVWEDGGLVGRFHCRAVKGPLPHAFPLGETTEGKVGAADRLVRPPEFTKNHIEVEHRPEPQWLYEHQPTEVKCSACGEAFEVSELRSDYGFSGPDGDEIWSNRICPKCGEWDCCDVEYERP